MADQSAIEWTDATWNPVTGCDRVSPGCAHCYALDLAARLKRMGNPRYRVDGDPKSSGPGFGVTLHSDVLGKPQRWRKPRRVFVNSMSDLFHEEVPARFIAEVFAVMSIASQHIFQVLTKRPERMQRLLTDPWWLADFERRRLAREAVERLYANPWPLPNVWLGVSIENRRLVHRADVLRQTPAAVRFISAEPLLGPLVLDGVAPDPEGGVIRHWKDHKPQFYNPPLDLTGIDWLIVGGESGPKHRPIRAEWVRALRDAAQDAGTSFFFKQWGGPKPTSGGRLLDGREYSEFPTQHERSAHA